MNTQLKPTLGTLHLWGIAVGLVISGEYFGWSYGWGVAGTLGFLVTSLMVAAMYTCFIFSFTELTTAIPHAGGPFAYSRRAFGEKGGLIAGLATLIEFVFAPPAIALAIGAYLNVQFPALDPKHAAVGAYFVFMGLNILGVKLAATFELVVCVLAVAELLVFMGVVAPAFSFSNFALNGWAGADTFGAPAIAGIFAAIPFAIWFFLAIEGAAMAAEEAGIGHLVDTEKLDIRSIQAVMTHGFQRAEQVKTAKVQTLTVQDLAKAWLLDGVARKDGNFGHVTDAPYFYPPQKRRLLVDVTGLS